MKKQLTPIEEETKNDLKTTDGISRQRRNLGSFKVGEEKFKSFNNEEAIEDHLANGNQMNTDEDDENNI